MSTMSDSTVAFTQIQRYCSRGTIVVINGFHASKNLNPSSRLTYFACFLIKIAICGRVFRKIYLMATASATSSKYEAIKTKDKCRNRVPNNSRLCIYKFRCYWSADWLLSYLCRKLKNEHYCFTFGNKVRVEGIAWCHAQRVYIWIQRVGTIQLFISIKRLSSSG